ncbi:MAG: cysteine--tRNA ligase [Capsulimonadaceae bacterium]|nr:cysteine--tRNA ligase [Capsulimonadaceae bacterium]
MGSVRLYNTLTRRKEEFTPADGKTVRLYCCGPTVYNFAHIGNLRTYLFEDLLHRTLLRAGWRVEHVMNITDVGHMTSDADTGEDKMMKAAIREQRSPWEIARFYEDAFLRDLGRLGIIKPSVTPRATEHVAQMIALIERLEARGITYRTDEGIYFDTARDPDYGKLADLHVAGQIAGAREEVNVDPGKRHPADFILWFTNKPNHIMQWDSPWGRGYPGWHIECSAMSMTYLGNTLDIHCGGIDHIPVHNTNEIAQSESATSVPFARFWVHGAFLNVKGSGGPGHAKMAKSGDNFITVERLIERGYHPLAYRYLCMTAHYRSEMAFSWASLDAATKALSRIYELRGRLGERVADDPLNPAQFADAVAEIDDALADDLNAPRAIALLHEAGSYRLWKEFDRVLGLDIDKLSRPAREEEPLTEQLAGLARKRDEARRARRFDEADRLRDEIEKLGYLVGDGVDGSTIRRRLV